MRLACLVFLLFLSPRCEEFEPTSAHVVHEVQGWRVYVSGRLREGDRASCDLALELLGVKLFDVRRRVPPGALTKLREVPIWLGLEDAHHPCACYHPSLGWLEEHGYNPDKAKSVDIANARTFLDWSLEQPAMVLHELAHAYHDRILGFHHAGIRAAYERARASGGYDEVLHAGGDTTRAYALENEREFFAELSEAYFGTNDFYPFVRAEVQQHDPETLALLEEVWGN
jgi:hypothetical protein